MFKFVFGVCLFLTVVAFPDESAAGDDIKAKLKPESLEFSGLDSEIEKYLNSVPEDKKKAETTRIGIVKNFKKMVQKVINRSPYEGKIFMKDKVIFGKITEAKDESLTVISGNSETMTVKWEDLHPRQYSDIFISEAVSKGEELEVGKVPQAAEKSFVKAGNYYYALAIFYDWYDNDAASKLYRQKALILNPKLKPKIDELWPDKENLKN